MSPFLNKLMKMTFAPRWSVNVSLCAEHESKTQGPGGTEVPASLGCDGLGRAPEPLQASQPQVSICSSIFRSFSSLQSLCNSSGRLQIEHGSSSAACLWCDPWARTCMSWILPPRALQGFPNIPRPRIFPGLQLPPQPFAVHVLPGAEDTGSTTCICTEINPAQPGTAIWISSPKIHCLGRMPGRL